MHRRWPALVLGSVALLASWAVVRTFQDWKFRSALMKPVDEDITPTDAWCTPEERLVDLRRSAGRVAASR